MKKHPNKVIRRVEDIDDEFLKFRLTKEQRAKAGGEKITFRKANRRYKERGYLQLLSRAEYNKLDPKTGKKHSALAASKLLGIVFDDDPEWLCETDKTRSPKPERREPAVARKHETNLNITSLVASLFAEDLVCEESCVRVKKIPLPLFLAVALVCSCRGLTDTTSVANYWNANLKYLQTLFPSYGLGEISHDAVRRIYMSLNEQSARSFMKGICGWLPKWTICGRRHYAVDGQSCRASRNVDDDRRMMMLNAVDVAAGKLCASHMMISTKSQEPKYVAEVLQDFELHGATVTLDALNTTPDVAKAIVSGGGFYLLAVKRNQPTLYDAVTAEINKARDANQQFDKIFEKHEHGRFDGQAHVVVPAAGLPKTILAKWPGLEEGCLIKARTTSFRRAKDDDWGESDETRCFITCHPYGDGSISEWLAACVRGHWGVESLHWTMDAIWKQDQMQCMYPGYLRMRETLAKLGHNLLVTLRKIDQEERKLQDPRSETQLSHEVGVTFENGLSWLEKIFRWKRAEAEKENIPVGRATGEG